MRISISPTHTSLFGLGCLRGSAAGLRGGWSPSQLPLGQSLVQYSHTHTGVRSRPRGLNPSGFSDLPGAKPVKTRLSEGRFPPGRTGNSAGSRPLGAGFRHLVSRPPLLHVYLWAQREPPQAQEDCRRSESVFCDWNKKIQHDQVTEPLPLKKKKHAAIQTARKRVVNKTGHRQQGAPSSHRNVRIPAAEQIC